METFNLNCNFKTIDVEGKKVQTYSIGEGEKVIFSFPAYPHSGLMYILFMLKYDLSKVRLITFDLPGWVGTTEKFEEGNNFNPDTVIKIAKAVINEYRIKNFNVLGFSFGSYLALLIANAYKDRVEKIALVSPVIRSSLVRGTVDAIKIRLVKYLGLYFLIKPYVYWRFSIYSKVFLKDGMPIQFIYMYKKMMEGMKSRYVFESIYHLFFSDNSQLIKDLADKEILIANSKTETAYFRKQSGYIRQILKGEKSLYLRGNHEDFILYPKKEVVSRIVRFLTT